MTCISLMPLEEYLRRSAQGRSPSLQIPYLQRCFPSKNANMSTVRIVVTSNAEQYRVVDFTSANDGASIRQRIYSKLNIPSDRQPRFQIYQSDVGSYALGDALSDGELLDLYQSHGDSSGSLKFFVSAHPNRPSSTYDDPSLAQPHTRGRRLYIRT
ncbi:hypothetical protein DL96DRAFT_767095 [Flagelloscypha sp. PMI_526]|nr:hypothetical protein DL96DRAFT_767095 [Flagelloscypha sp. PMI_526]